MSNDIDTKLAVLSETIESLTALAIKQQMSIIALRMKLTELMVKNYGGDAFIHDRAFIALEEYLHEAGLIGIEDFDPRLAARLDKRKGGSSGDQQSS
jgi:hypothetical protein